MTNDVENNYDKKKLIILRALLIVIGGAIGALALWQYFVYYPELLRREYQIIITVVSALFLAAIFGVSAKPCYRLISGVVSLFMSLARSLGGKGVVAVVAGIFAAVMLGFLLDVIIRMFIEVWAVRLLADILAVAVFSLLLCYAFTKWVASDDSDAADRGARTSNGYLLTATCFSDPRVFTAVDALGNVKVGNSVFQALFMFGTPEAAERLNAVLARGAECIKDGGEFKTEAEYVRGQAELAAAKKLRLVYARSDKPDTADGVCLSSFAPPTEEVIAGFVRTSKDEE